MDEDDRGNMDDRTQPLFFYEGGKKIQDFSEESNELRLGDNMNIQLMLNGKTVTVQEFHEATKKRREQEITGAYQTRFPIGTVVELKDLHKHIMLIGFNALHENTVYDYLACPYPVGVSDNTPAIYCNHDQIDSIFHAVSPFCFSALCRLVYCPKWLL